jgi:hypothetical protein
MGALPGDRTNDGPARMWADGGVAMGGQRDIAIELAEAIVVGMNRTGFCPPATRSSPRQQLCVWRGASFDSGCFPPEAQAHRPAASQQREDERSIQRGADGNRRLPEQQPEQHRSGARRDSERPPPPLTLDQNPNRSGHKHPCRQGPQQRFHHIDR